MLVSLVSIYSNQYKITETTAQYITQLLYYYATHPDANICYMWIDMVFRVHSEVSYLS